MQRAVLIVLMVLSVARGTPALARAQLGTGAVNGVVKDMSDAVVAGAKVEVVNASTGLRRDTTAGPGGTFVVPVLPAGTYTVSVFREGFAASWKAENVEVNVGDSASVAVTLQ